MDTGVPLSWDRIKQELYQGWPEWQAQADWNQNKEAKIGVLRGRGILPEPPKSAEQLANERADALMNAAKMQIEEEKKTAQKLFVDNPFSFDEYLAKESARQEYLPYYTELLNDYLGKVGVSQDTLQSQDKLLRALKGTNLGTAGVENRNYERAVSSAEKGFAGQGMFFSGIKDRALGAGEAERNYDVGTKATEVSNYNRDLFGTGRQYEASLAGGVEQRRGEALKQYYTPRVMEYNRLYPTGSNTLSGYVPPEYLRY